MGQTGGTIRSEIYTGFTSNVRAQKSGVFHDHHPMCRSRSRRMSHHPIFPSNGDEPAIITIVTTLPNGQQKVDTIAVNRRANSSMSRTIKDGKVTSFPRLHRRRTGKNRSFDAEDCRHQPFIRDWWMRLSVFPTKQYAALTNCLMMPLWATSQSAVYRLPRKRRMEL